ncbi:unnamed protein product [Clonostachys rosea]|uniref:Protein kinase domain-containing protein n=1 Tax=Bionectria ochroleuca TaxID=29856 RepID=A0ABY6UDB1_BIOOC|nr:unnamed protein product [Clonostachys rosea]
MSPPSDYPPPPPDPRRPPVPYHAGTSLTIQSHLPPDPLGPGYFTGPPARNRFLGLKFWNDNRWNQTEWCLQEHPLIETPPPSPVKAHTLHILSEVAVKDGRGPQVVRCYLDDCENTTYIAKIFDPLYYKYPGDASWCADHDYSLESSAYEEIKDSGNDGKYTPTYFGSFSFSLPLLDTPQSTGLTCTARMVLIEDIPGVSLQTLIKEYIYCQIPPRLRLDIMAEVIEMECRLYFIGVKQGDLAPRKVMLTMDPSDYTRPPSRIVLLDFAYSSVMTWSHFRVFGPQIPK